MDIFHVTESQVTGLHKCDDCLQCLEFDQGQFLFVLTQFTGLWLVHTLSSSPPIGRWWHLCAPIVWLRVAQSWIKLWLARPGHPGFYLQFHSPHCLGHPAPGHQDIRGHLVPWYTFISTGWCFVLWLFSMFARLISASLLPVTFGSHNSLMSLVNLNPRFRRKVQY